MRIRLLQAGWENFTGHMGVMEFKDGVSVNTVSPRDVARLAANMNCEVVDEPAKLINPAAVFDARVPLTSEQMPVEEKEPEAKVETPAPKVWTFDELARVADAHGIKGLRQIADPMGIKGTSMREIMEEIIKSYGKDMAGEAPTE